MENLETYITIGIFLLLMIFSLIRRKRGTPVRTPFEAALSLYREVAANEQLAEKFRPNLKVNRFITSTWTAHQAKLDFLDAGIRSSLAQSYSMMEDFNNSIAMAKKNKSTAYLYGVDASRLKPMLAKNRESLENWLKANTESQQVRRGRLSG